MVDRAGPKAERVGGVWGIRSTRESTNVAEAGCSGTMLPSLAGRHQSELFRFPRGEGVLVGCKTHSSAPKGDAFELEEQALLGGGLEA